jgi:hypothetical protein
MKTDWTNEEVKALKKVKTNEIDYLDDMMTRSPIFKKYAKKFRRPKPSPVSDGGSITWSMTVTRKVII